jgi:putative copper export protein
MIFDKSFVDALSPRLLNQVITTTGFGASWRLQVWAIGVLIIIVFYLSRRLKHEPSSEHRIWWWACLAAGAVLLLAPTWTGHAVVAAKQFPFAIGADWLHLIGAGFWVGGLFHLALTMPKAISILDEHGRLRVLHRIISLFTRLAIVSTVVITLTGIYNSWMHVDRIGELWSTPYGETLLVKVLLVIPMIALGGLNTFILHPRASRLLEKEESALDVQSGKMRRSFYRSVIIEAALGVFVLLAAAILVFLQPAREHPVSNNSRSDSIIVALKLADQRKE